MSLKFKFRNPEVRFLSKCVFFLFLTFNVITLQTFNSGAQGVTKYGEITVTSTNFVNLNGRIASSMALDRRGLIIQPPLICGNTLAVTHTLGDGITPVTKTVNYGTVATAIAGTGNKCWITQNLGADHQASSATDGTEPSAGWYWQFNRKQGYKHDGTNITPAWTITSIDETSDWLPANDPCTLSLGTGWRIPTNTEWTNSDTNGQVGGWDNYTETFADVLKLHTAGYLRFNDGWLYSRGNFGFYWSSTQSNSTFSWSLYFLSGNSIMDSNYKTYGFSVRCLKDDSPPVFTCGYALAVTQTLGDGIAPETKTVNYGTVTTTLSGASKCWITQNLGATNQATSAIDNTEASAGWYWQFNRKQGYKHDGTTRTPATTWITSISEFDSWLPANDPCTLSLGTGWRIPTNTEWTNANGGWANFNNTYASVLKLHTAGCLYPSNGSLYPRGTYGYYWSSTAGSPSISRNLTFSIGGSGVTDNDKAYGFSVRCLGDNTTPFSCGNGLAVIHTAGTVAPVTKTVNYGTVQTSLSGASKCWITQNLGADNQATSATDGTEAAAGWYWQFNRKRGYKHDGAARTPAIAWNASISETSDWLPANDPCTLSLGSGWRIPTSTEWTNADATGGWVSYTGTFASALKLHAAGYLASGNGVLYSRGANGYAWSSTQSNATFGWFHVFTNSSSDVNSNLDKANGISLRCLKDDPALAFSCGNALAVTHMLGEGVAPVTKTVNYGTVQTSLSGASKCWITQNLGADHQASSATDGTEPSAGWYWQFNLKQGYKHTGETTTTILTPTWTIPPGTDNSNWLAANDPCTLSLGTGWRIPTYVEWTNANSTGGWANYDNTYTSVLKLHAAGYLNASDGSLSSRSAIGAYWNSTQIDAASGRYLSFTSSHSGMSSNFKACGFALRCLKD